jgi:hypothetical protein
MKIIKYIKIKFILGYIVYNLLLQYFCSIIWPFFFFKLYNNFFLCNIFSSLSLFCFFYEFISAFISISGVFFIFIL